MQCLEIGSLDLFDGRGWEKVILIKIQQRLGHPEIVGAFFIAIPLKTKINGEGWLLI